MAFPSSRYPVVLSPNSGPPPSSNAEQRPEDRVRNFISQLLETTVDELMKPNGRPFILLKRRSNRGDYFINPHNAALEAREEDKAIMYSWPGDSAYEAWRFTVSIRVLGVIADALRNNITTSKRDIYYSDPIYFGSQRVVDTLVDDIAYTIGVDRAALHVTAAAKGLMAGDFSLALKLGNILDIGAASEDFLIPDAEGVDEIIIFDIRWVLIVEKEASYLSQIDTKPLSYFLKGRKRNHHNRYPDINTRAFIRLLSETKSFMQDTPHLYALVDSDPDGMAIMSTYKYGSMTQAHENARLNVSGICWLGLRTSDVVAGADPQGDEALMPLSVRDRQKAVAILRNNPVFAEDGPEPQWRTELQQMLMLNLKAETEVLYDRDQGLEGWIDQQIRKYL
ncbi:meiotic recombination protein spo11 [Paecilomyces variotii]|uniref:DNA topoisomerase (ATP-hydrolyzing) n=1 Tax=Byssochlamys spectabilis TaxID=264951 RepID=A0A443HJR7_BYSSP|nr:meiotic recombination protein spo11 [Paecilomyces variotii]RWQ92019.1 meiotic recombination protein spo11 [Paecilomyces variotii]